MTDSDLHQIIHAWNETATDYPRDLCIHELFEAQAEKTPSATALVFGETQASYQEINRRANQFGHFLRRHGVGPDQLVGVLADRSVEMIVAMLAILKAGGAFLPLDPTHPRERLAQLIEDAQPSILLTLERFSERLPSDCGPIFYLDSQPCEWESYSRENLVNTAWPDSLAYVMYTSGSTGKPKGVCVVHRGVVRLVKQTDYLQLSASEVFLQLAPITFDASTLEIWGCLLNGGMLVVMPPEMPSLEEIGMAIRRHRVTTMWLTSALFQRMVETNLRELGQLRQLIIGGDVLPIVQVQKFLVECNGVRLLNGYGPTENTTFTATYEIPGARPSSSQIPIGRPIANTQIYLLSPALQLTRIGVPGELFAGGDGLARGYLHDPVSTAERFIPNPFSAEPGARMYQTGDLARYQPDGVIDFLGRIDFQLKVRGGRIEPGEIEAVLNQHSLVQQSVVTARGASAAEKRLVAYLVPHRQVVYAEQQRQEDQLHMERIEQWQKIYDEVIYHEMVEPRRVARDPKFNITGWDSSYTGLPLTDQEMREQVDQTVERILRLRPARVLEIGCGTGLLLFRIAPDCERYWGTDFSDVALRHVRHQMERPGESLPQVSIFKRMADDFDEIEPESFDMVILNSISQHLPSIDYLVRVLAQAVRSVKAGGHIFVGDVRSLPLLKAFHASVQLFHAAPSLTPDDFARLVQKEVAQDEELVIHPDFFSALQKHLPVIKTVEIRLKRGRFQNEITRFRYDVVMQVGGEVNSVNQPKRLAWQADRLTLAGIRRQLEEAQPEALWIEGVPNLRLLAEQKALEFLSRRLPDTVGKLRQFIRKTPAQAIDPEEFWQLSDDLLYDVEALVSPTGDDFCFDVAITRRSLDARLIAPSRLTCEPETTGVEWNRYANMPLRHAVLRKLVPQLRSYLKAKFPDYMIPSAFVFLDQLPLTASGKLNRSALPAPDRERPDIGLPLVAPRTPVESLIASIWQKVLEVELVGIHDNFFELGGDSLKAVQVVSEIRRLLKVQLSTISLFDKATISEIVDVLASEKNRQQHEQKMGAEREYGKNRRAKRLERMRRQGQSPAIRDQR